MKKVRTVSRGSGRAALEFPGLSAVTLLLLFLFAAACAGPRQLSSEASLAAENLRSDGTCNAAIEQLERIYLDRTVVLEPARRDRSAGEPADAAHDASFTFYDPLLQAAVAKVIDSCPSGLDVTTGIREGVDLHSGVPVTALATTAALRPLLFTKGSQASGYRKNVGYLSPTFGPRTGDLTGENLAACHRCLDEDRRSGLIIAALQHVEMASDISDPFHGWTLRSPERYDFKLFTSDRQAAVTPVEIVPGPEEVRIGVPIGRSSGSGLGAGLSGTGGMAVYRAHQARTEFRVFRPFLLRFPRDSLSENTRWVRLTAVEKPEPSVFRRELIEKPVFEAIWRFKP